MRKIFVETPERYQRHQTFGFSEKTIAHSLSCVCANRRTRVRLRYESVCVYFAFARLCFEEFVQSFTCAPLCACGIALVAPLHVWPCGIVLFAPLLLLRCVQYCVVWHCGASRVDSCFVAPFCCFVGALASAAV